MGKTEKGHYTRYRIKRGTGYHIRWYSHLKRGWKIRAGVVAAGVVSVHANKPSRKHVPGKFAPISTSFKPEILPVEHDFLAPHPTAAVHLGSWDARLLLTKKVEILPKRFVVISVRSRNGAPYVKKRCAIKAGHTLKYPPPPSSPPMDV